MITLVADNFKLNLRNEYAKRQKSLTQLTSHAAPSPCATGVVSQLRFVFKAYVDEDALASVEVPDNVLVCQTIPLATLLAHPKTVLLINQAGSNRCVAVSCKEEFDF